MPLAGSQESAKIDSLAQKDYDLSSEVLMESAGALSAQEIVSFNPSPAPKKTVLILCGPGSNGGDGLVTARHLLSEGFNVKVFLPEAQNTQNKLKNALWEKQKKRLRLMGVKLLPLKDLQHIKQCAENSCFIVDALFGVGLARNIEGFYADLIQMVNSFKKKVISLDTPSGLDVDTGCIKGQAVKADFTFSFGLPKPGFYLIKGPCHVGQLKVFSIGNPANSRNNIYKSFLIDKHWVSAQLPIRQPTDHKARQGHLLVLAGSKGMWGAGGLTSLAAYRMGAGYVTWAVPDLSLQASSAFVSAVPDVLTQNLWDPQIFKNKTAVAIGPGFGTEAKTKEFLLKLKKTKLPVVVDADAFTVCVKNGLFPLPPDWVLTPHSGELARMFDVTSQQVDQDRLSYALKASKQGGCWFLLKGLHSVLAGEEKRWIIPTGNSALAKAGTGDVLTGFIGALMARGLPAFSAVAVGAFIHGLLAEHWLASGKDADSLMAQDLKEILPTLLKTLRSVD